MSNSAKLLYEGLGRGMERVETPKLISIQRNDAQNMRTLRLSKVLREQDSEAFTFWGRWAGGAKQRRFGTALGSHLQMSSSALKMGPPGCPEMSVTN
jgi:hypothetical protein